MQIMLGNKPKKVRENNDAPIIEDWVSDEEDDDEPNLKVEKKTVIPTATKKEYVKPEKPVKKSVRYAEMYRPQRPRGNQRNWNGQKSNELGCNFVIEQVAARSGMDSKMAELLSFKHNLQQEAVLLTLRKTLQIIPPVFSSFYNNTYLKDVQAIYAKELPISSPDPITPPAILTLSPILPSSLLFNPRYFSIPEELLPPKKRIHSPSVNPFPNYIFEIGKCSIKMHLKHHEKQIEDILNYLDELSFHRIEKMEEGRINGNELKTELKRIRTQIIKLQKKQLGQKDKITFAHYRISDLEQIIEKKPALHQQFRKNFRYHSYYVLSFVDRMPPKRTSTSETPAITLDAIRQLTVDFIAALEAQTAAMAVLVILLETPAMLPKRISTSAAPTMTQDAIRQLVANSVATALKAQDANMANTDNTNKNIVTS
ncbi:hypothetical protein Tco_1055928 [Tanacetum coccineum]|uniref:Uncharacterized protein n=1 Tax=Tanacetum coccineum TaxID=301880 RepID=A0ABQ5H129_9ASTR